MIHHRIEQNGPVWETLRLAIPTTSEFKQIITPKEGKLSAQAEPYMARLLAEWYCGGPLFEANPKGGWLDHGHELEPRAMQAYAWERNVDPEPGGFFTTNDGMVGSSPDRIVGVDGLLELKCPSAWVHMQHMLKRAINEEHRPQVQGQLWVCEREWGDVQSYNVEMPPDAQSVIVRAVRNEEYIAKIADAMARFTDSMLSRRAWLEQTFGPRRRADAPKKEVVDALGVSDEDVTAIWDARENQ